MKEKSKSDVVREHLKTLGWVGVHPKIAEELEVRFEREMATAEQEILKNVVSHAAVADLAHTLAKEEKRGRRGQSMAIPPVLAAQNGSAA
jgi:hypothetical protein